MKKVCLPAVLLSLSLLVSTAIPSELEVSVTENLTSMPLAFTENRGQWDEEVMFRANAGGATMWFTGDGAYYQFTRSVNNDESADANEPGERGESMEQQPNNTETMMIRASFVGANFNPAMRGEDVLDYKCNYFIGNDPSRWRTDVPNYSAVVYEEVYPGIDLKYYGNGREMEYDFIVLPGADPSRIEIQYEGVESVSINGNGELVVETEWGGVIERRPVVYQIQNYTRVPIEGRYKLVSENSFCFCLGSDYNPTLALVIDPVLSYSTYLGAGGTEYGEGIAVDASGAAYVVGRTASSGFPMQDPYQGTFYAGYYDVFVTKLSAEGNSLVYSTYLGGTGEDWGEGIAVDGSGSAYVVGRTASNDFPTQDAYQGTYQGVWDAFITKLNASGNGLIYSTYLGGSYKDVGFGVSVDAVGSAYVSGYTSSMDFPTENGYQETHQGGAYDVFVSKLSAGGASMIYSTYLGGSDDELSYCIAVDSAGSAYLTGLTVSDDFPTVNPYQGTLQGDLDAFVTKLSAGGNSLVYSTYLGGSYVEEGWCISVDAAGAAYIAGQTNSDDFPTENGYQETHLGGHFNDDAFVTKLSSGGNSLVYSTFLGGTSGEHGYAIAVDAVGSAYVTGYTDSEDFPTESGYQEAHQGISDAFVTRLSVGGNSLLCSGYLGGSGSEFARGIAVDATGSVYVTGATSSTDFPTESGYQETYQGAGDVFVTRLTEVSCCQLRGDSDKNGQVDILDIDYFIAWLYRGGAEPDCYVEADVDDNTQDDVLDIDYLIAFLFRGGQGPVPCP